MKNTFLNGILVLFVGSIIAKVLGAVYRIPLTFVLGAEGLGVYQLVFPVFSLILVLSSSGMPTAISKMIAKTKDDHFRAKQILKTSLIAIGFFGFCCSLVLFLLSGILSNLQGNILAKWSFMAISPAIFFVAILSCFRGYFQGMLNMVPTVVSSILEQLFKLLFGLLFGFLLVPYGIEFGAVGAIFGVVFSEIIATIYMFFEFKKFEKKQVVIKSTVVSKKVLLKELLKTACPIVFAGAIIPFSIFLDSMLVLNLLKISGVSLEQGTILWGIDSGVVASILNMPIVLTLSVAIAVVPEIAKNTHFRQKSINTSFLLSFGLSLFFCFFVFCSSGDIISFLYSTSLGGSALDEKFLATNLLMLSCFLIPLTSILQTQNSILQGVDKANIPLVNMFCCLFLKIICLLIFVPILGIYGLLIAKYVFFGFSVIFNYIYMKKHNFVSQNVGMYGFKIFFSVVSATFVVLILNNLNFTFSVYVLLPLKFCAFLIICLFSFWCLGIRLNFKKFFNLRKKSL